jgi:hypothetical protein
MCPMTSKSKLDIEGLSIMVIIDRLVTGLGRRKRTLYIPEDIDRFIRYRAIEQDKKFSDILEDCLRYCFSKELEKAKRKTC